MTKQRKRLKRQQRKIRRRLVRNNMIQLLEQAAASRVHPVSGLGFALASLGYVRLREVPARQGRPAEMVVGWAALLGRPLHTVPSLWVLCEHAAKNYIVPLGVQGLQAHRRLSWRGLHRVVYGPGGTPA